MDEGRTNEGYVITNAISVGNTEFVLGVHRKNPNQFVTWECKDKTKYFWGHYTDSLLKATKDLCERVLTEVQFLEKRQVQAGRTHKQENKEQER